MTDLYKLEWIHSIKTIQRGMSQSLNKDAFMDTILVCQDGIVTHNKLVLGLIFPELRHIPVFEQPFEQTLIMPEWAVAEVQNLISQLFPDSDLTSAGLKEDDIEASVNDNFEHFLETETVIQNVDSSPRAFGMRRGRGRPPLSNTARMPPRFTCDYCHKGFFYRSMLTAHEKLHTGGSRETCELCGAEYSTRQNLKNHMIKHHGEDSFTTRKRGRPPLDPERQASMISSAPASVAQSTLARDTEDDIKKIVDEKNRNIESLEKSPISPKNTILVDKPAIPKSANNIECLSDENAVRLKSLQTAYNKLQREFQQKEEFCERLISKTHVCLKTFKNHNEERQEELDKLKAKLAETRPITTLLRSAEVNQESRRYSFQDATIQSDQTSIW